MALGGWTLGRAAPAQVLGRDGTQAAAESSLYGGSLGRVVWFGEQRYSSTYAGMSCEQLIAAFNDASAKKKQAEQVLGEPTATEAQIRDMEAQKSTADSVMNAVLKAMCTKKCSAVSAGFCAGEGLSWG